MKAVRSRAAAHARAAFWIGWLGAGAAALPAAAAAETPAAGTTDPAARSAALAALREGNALLKEGHAAEALAKFEETYRTFPSPRVHYNLGQAHAALPG